MLYTSYHKISGKQVLLLSMLFLGYSAHAQIMTTVAGNGTAGYNEERMATAAELSAPVGIAVSGNGTLYVADGMNNRIRKITQQGAISTIAGNDDPDNTGDGGPATDGQLNDPAGVATDASGNVYIADKYNNRIRKIAPSGILSAFAGSGVPGYAGDRGNATAAQLKAPAGIAVDNAGNVYIADAGNNCIRKVTPAGMISTIAGNGVAGYAGDGGNATAAQLNAPASIAVDSAGNVYIADAMNYRIRKVTAVGIIATIAGTGAAGYSGDGKMDTLAVLNLPTGIALDKAGNVYIADQGNNRIRKITTEGIISTVAGSGIAGYSGDGGNALAGDMNAPYGIAVDAAGNVYVAEQENNRIRKVTPPPAASMVKNTTKTPATKNTNLPPISNPPMNNFTPTNTGYQYTPGAAPKTTTSHHKNNG